MRLVELFRKGGQAVDQSERHAGSQGFETPAARQESQAAPSGIPTSSSCLQQTHSLPIKASRAGARRARDAATPKLGQSELQSQVCLYEALYSQIHLQSGGTSAHAAVASLKSAGQAPRQLSAAVYS